MTRLRLSFPEDVLFRHELPVRIGDLNYGAHLAHDRLISLLHEVRARFFRHFELEEWATDGRPMIVLDLAVKYHSQAFFGDQLRVEMAAGETGSRACELWYRVSQVADGTVVAVARTGVGFLDRDRDRLAVIPEAFRRILESGTGTHRREC